MRMCSPVVDIPIKIEEPAGIDRVREPVSIGIPFKRGLVAENDLETLGLTDPENQNIDCQTQVLAKWPDDSLKWVLLDFQASIKAYTKKEWILSKVKNSRSARTYCHEIKCREEQDHIRINTGTAVFSLNKNRFDLFAGVTVKGSNLINSLLSKIILTDENNSEYNPYLKKIYIETKGPQRCTIKAEGVFKDVGSHEFASFFARICFYAQSAVVRIDFTLLNSKPAHHPGGLWDLGDKGSVFFKDLSLHFGLDTNNQTHLYWKDEPGKPYEKINGKAFKIYQDSSGGVNWNSPNHVNRNNELKIRFQGYKAFVNESLIKQGFRPEPVLSLQDGQNRFQTAIKHFWQNFPKSIRANDNTIILGLFPGENDDLFELQGGEQKTHTVFFDFCSEDAHYPLDWIHTPLIPVLTAKTYTDSKVFSFFTHERTETLSNICEIIDSGIKGNQSFFTRREIIDEFGWRHFGDLYADHETVLKKTDEIFPSHYNNQYDCIYGLLQQYMVSENKDWFILADELCRHIKDIDIYHTDQDRPEYNHGLFWHTEHYIKAETATHRCFSKRHQGERNLNFYGGGPSLSHTYATGLLHHYYLTGDLSSKEAVLELAAFVVNNMDMHHTLANRVVSALKSLKKNKKTEDLVNLNKVYSLDGPGRASGNALSTLTDAYRLTCKKKYLLYAEKIIYTCISPQDDIEKRDLLDVENRWMYTVFLQALGKYLDSKYESGDFDHAFGYARKSLIEYARWMAENEEPYLSRPEKLEYPNETWAAQEIRKANVLFYAVRYSKPDHGNQFLKKAETLFLGAVESILTFKTRTLTRPIALLMQNFMTGAYFQTHIFGDNMMPPPQKETGKRKNIFGFSLKKELEFIKWRLNR